jgi:hypothetical protein
VPRDKFTVFPDDRFKDGRRRCQVFDLRGSSLYILEPPMINSSTKERPLSEGLGVYNNVKHVDELSFGIPAVNSSMSTMPKCVAEMLAVTLRL